MVTKCCKHHPTASIIMTFMFIKCKKIFLSKKILLLLLTIHTNMWYHITVTLAKTRDKTGTI